MAPNVPEFAAAYYGILRAGAVVVPLDADLKRDELRLALADAGARLLIGWRDLLRADLRRADLARRAGLVLRRRRARRRRPAPRSRAPRTTRR